jgi:hypothetical protein
MHTITQSENLKERNHLPDLHIQDRIILKFIIHNKGMNMWMDPTDSEEDKMMGYVDTTDEAIGLIRGGSLLTT